MRLRIAPRPPGQAQVDLVCHGESSVDLALVLDGRLPAADEDKCRVSSMASRLGGQAATAAVACRRLGWHARYVGVLGRDDAGERVRAGLEAEGVEVAALWRDGIASRSAVVVVEGDTGRRLVLEHRSEGLARTSAEWPSDEETGARVLLTDATDLQTAIHVARSARRRGIPVIVDVDRDAPQIAQVLAAADILVMPAAFALSFAGTSEPGAALKGLAGRFDAAATIVTLGPDGSLARIEGREISTRPPQVDVVDTTGAGDAFRGGLAAAWLEGGEDATPEFLLTFANVVAALSCRALGAQAGLPVRGELDRFL
jgi:sugar/nucleoside kinase (ribokinase family)